MARIERFRHGSWWPMNPGSGVPEAPLPAPPRINDDLPAIRETRPTWWQVRRTEQDMAGRRCEVLIFECRDETTAMKVCLAQKYSCRIVKWGDKRRPFENFNKPIKMAETADPRRI